MAMHCLLSAGGNPRAVLLNTERQTDGSLMLSCNYKVALPLRVPLQNCGYYLRISWDDTSKTIWNGPTGGI